MLVTNAADTLSFGPDPFPDLGYTAPAFPGPVSFSPATVVIDPVDADMNPDHPGTEAPATCERAGMSVGDWGCGSGGTCPVGSYPKGVSPYGAHDMAGAAGRR